MGSRFVLVLEATRGVQKLSDLFLEADLEV